MFVLVVLLSCLVKSGSLPFNPRWHSFDAFGMKLAANDYVIATARNDLAQFVLQFGPFDSNNISDPCSVDYPGLATGDINFVYNVAAGKQINGSNAPSTVIAFAGENYNPVNSSVTGPFIGQLRNNSTASCSIHSAVHYFATSNEHEEWSVLGVDPSGTIAYSFGQYFGVVYNLNTDTIVTSWQNDSTFWPNSSHFLPHAIDISSAGYGVIAGFAKQNTTGSYKLVIHLLQMNTTSVQVVDTWTYPPANSTWQASSMNWDADLFQSKYIMSVSIDSFFNLVVVGVQSINIVFRFKVILPSNQLSYQSSQWNGKHLGYGKSVAWLDEGSTIVVLANEYSLHYEWISSQIYMYNSSDVPMASSRLVFPSNQMSAWDGLESILVAMVTTSTHIVILDDNGQAYVIRSAPAGYYSLTNTAVGQNPAFSSFNPCSPGTYKTQSGFELCTLCPVGTSNSLFSLSTSCVNYSCSDPSFCPIGSIINDTYSTIMIDTNQALAYPSTPDSAVFDDILMEHVFSIGKSSRCVPLSPLFWALFLANVTAVISIIMGILKYSKRSIKLRTSLKRIFQQIDLVSHGESWVTGLASLSLMVVLGLSYYFSRSFLYQYPVETAGDSTFTCDSELRNVKFFTNIQPLMIPRDEEKEPVFDLLNEQELLVTMEFVNTMLNCSNIEVQEYLHSIYHPLEMNCTEDSEQYIISVAIQITKHSGQFQYILNDINPIGGLRLSITGPAGDLHQEHYYAVQEIQYSQSFHRYGKTLAHNPTIKVELTKVINLTEPLQLGALHKFSGLWLPVMLSQTEDLFHKPEEAQTYALSNTTLTLLLSESSSYIWNQQMPIARSTEIIFHNLLFTIVCMELFGLLYLIGKLIFLPLFKLFRRHIEKSQFIQAKLGHSTSTKVIPIEQDTEKFGRYVNQETKTTIEKQTNVKMDAFLLPENEMQ